LFFCVASFPTPFAFLVAPSYTTSPVLEKTLSFDTLIRPLCISFVLRCCFSVLHRFLRPSHSSLLRLTPRHLSWLGKDALIWHSRLPFVYFLCASICSCVASFPTASTFLVASSYTTSLVLRGKVLDPSFKEEERRRFFLLRKALDPSRLCRELHKKRQNKCRILNSVLLPTY
jgi:hypothetical protein